MFAMNDITTKHIAVVIPVLLRPNIFSL